MGKVKKVDGTTYMHEDLFEQRIQEMNFDFLDCEVTTKMIYPWPQEKAYLSPNMYKSAHLLLEPAGDGVYLEVVINPSEEGIGLELHDGDASEPLDIRRVPQASNIKLEVVSMLNDYTRELMDEISDLSTQVQSMKNMLRLSPPDIYSQPLLTDSRSP